VDELSNDKVGSDVKCSLISEAQVLNHTRSSTRGSKCPSYKLFSQMQVNLYISLDRKDSSSTNFECTVMILKDLKLARRYGKDMTSKYDGDVNWLRFEQFFAFLNNS
jgi:hypothetical protein